jgi:hypothetical protein
LDASFDCISISLRIESISSMSFPVPANCKDLGVFVFLEIFFTLSSCLWASLFILRHIYFWIPQNLFKNIVNFGLSELLSNLALLQFMITKNLIGPIKVNRALIFFFLILTFCEEEGRTLLWNVVLLTQKSNSQIIKGFFFFCEKMEKAGCISHFVGLF